uniref:Uncharacterized protein n=1 Tax=Cacopsylla melanoneura TaxID=428564 RepID=A0A8D8SRD3_9HEMI
MTIHIMKYRFSSFLQVCTILGFTVLNPDFILLILPIICGRFLLIRRYSNTDWPMAIISTSFIMSSVISATARNIVLMKHNIMPVQARYRRVEDSFSLNQ